ncbi:MAG: HEAT repeat domain-containing protein, partial [Planctomycetaceae bacterium]|nr:HEAT repeat domain-containing protein [Planctomycetaceae bacterium]
GFKEAKETIDVLLYLEKIDQITAAVEKVGLKAFKTKVAKLLKNPDPAVRSYGVVWLLVLGGTQYKQDIAKLLDDKPGTPADRFERLSYNIERCVAAMALGEMGAKEYAPRLVALLKSSVGYDRTGAVRGLRSMGAKEHAKQIADLLSDENDILSYDDVRTAAIKTLAEFDATECAEQIASVLKEEVVSSEVAAAAGYALARLNGKAWSKDIATQLNDPTAQGDAAKALALLDAKEYTKEIARLLDAHDSRIRSDALIALGILDAQDYRTQIAGHLQEEDTDVRSYAAVTLLLMGDQEHSQGIRDVIHAEWNNPRFGFANDPVAHFSARIRLQRKYESDSLLEDRRQQLTQHAVEHWKQINRSGD